MKGVVAIGLAVAAFWWWRNDPDVEKGNAKVEDGRFEEALADFDRARPALSEEEQQRALDFDRGLALHGAGRADDARKAFAHAAQSKDPVMRSRAAYNEGNVALEQKDKDAAMGAFIRSLQADPTYAPAKRNLELLLTQPPPPPDGGEGGDSDGGPPPDGGGNGDGGGGGGDGGNGGDGGGGPSDGGQGKPGADGGSNDNSPPKMDQDQPQQVDKQDAMKLLDALRDAEKNRPLGRIMLKDSQPPRSGKPW